MVSERDPILARPSAGPDFCPVEEVVEPLDLSQYTPPLEERFGIPPATFEPYLLFRPNGMVLTLVNRDLQVPRAPPCRYLGMPFLHQKALRLTTAATQTFAHAVTRNLFDLQDDQLEDFVLGREIRLDEPQTAQLTAGGFVIARHRGLVLGQATYRAGGGVVRGLLPKAWRPQLYHLTAR